ncbi:MAG TPA: thioredoxin-like domain-containing protein [Gemmataceae bacterium]|jgi:thiol-disulfide isomerase/thioredoxin|nr:thioredoxin-like domain-containing protein [Gemmataceae bacterium]
MVKFRFGFRLLAALTLLAGLANAGLADDPTAATLLGYKPAQTVDVTIPAAAEVSTCTVKLEYLKKLPDGKQPTAWVVKDSGGKILRKFYDSTGTGGVNSIAYYRDGEEVYRDIITGGKINQFRWVGAEGSKWGVDLSGKGKVDSWVVISPEEVSQELLTAVLTNDEKRLEALLITPAELASMGLPQAEVARIQAKLAAAPATFAATTKALAGLKAADVSWIHLETKLPQTIPADSIGAAADVVKYKHGAILYQNGNGAGAKHDWLQTGEIIQVGKAWRLIQAPTAGMQNTEIDDTAKNGPGPIPIPKGAEKLIQDLNELDKAGPGPGKDGLIAFNLKRAGILQQIAALCTKAEDRDVWLRQVADAFAGAAQQGDKGSLDRLSQWKDAVAKEPGSTIVAYVQFRHMSSEYSVELGKIGTAGQDKLTKLQESWKEKLTKFINDHPKTDDTPDAMLQLGMVNEFFGSKMDGEAKAAYGLLIKNFPTHTLAKKAQGCLDRLTLEGNTIKLAGPTVGGGPQFNIASHAGKAVIVYYWASWNDLAQTDFSKITLALKAFPGKVELVGVNLDTAAGDALAFIKANNVAGTHLHMPGGLDSPLAAQYGITSLPVMFLVGPDGKVITRTAQAATVDEELTKIFKTEEKK